MSAGSQAGSQAALVPDASFPALKQLIIARTGHFYYDDKDDLLWERVSRRMRARGIASCGAYLERLREAGRGEAEWSALESEITIGETYFFRYADQFEALRGTVLPEIIARNAESRSIRVWSAGCSTGAEIYSVAILLRELLADRIGDWRIALLGTDIDEAALEAARDGVYGNWALRSTPQALREAYFNVQPGGKLFRLKPEYRAMARFERHNLLSLTDGTSPLHISEFDLVLCRNVLIYFHYETGEAILRGVRGTMRDGGWLLVGNAEPNPALASVFETVGFPGTTAYRRVEAAPERDGQGEAPAVPWTQVPETWTRPAPVRRAMAARRLAQLPAAQRAAAQPRPAPIAAPGGGQAGADDNLQALDRLAHDGAVPAALALCDRMIAAEGRDKTLHFRRGLYLHALGRDTDAEKALRAAIFLDRGFIAAHYQLGLLMAGRGRAREAGRSLVNAARLAGALAPKSEVPEAEGMTAAEMRDGIALQLDFLGLRGAPAGGRA